MPDFEPADYVYIYRIMVYPKGQSGRNSDPYTYGPWKTQDEAHAHVPAVMARHRVLVTASSTYETAVTVRRWDFPALTIELIRDAVPRHVAALQFIFLPVIP